MVLQERAKATTPALMNMLTNQDGGVRLTAAEALGWVRPGKGRVNEDYRAAYALKAPGAPASTAIPFIRPLLDDEDPQIRACATNALQAIDPTPLNRASRTK